jgi:molecular chaperone DnaJ
MAQNYYEILGVTKESAEDEIKSSYRKLAIKFHPDKNPNDPTAADKFQEISVAYQVLIDPQKRKSYDEELAAPKQKAKRPGAVPPFGTKERPGTDLADALRMFMDNMRADRSFQRNFTGFDGQAGQAQQGENIQLNIRLTLLEIANGIKKKVTVNHKKRCKSCNGTGDVEKKTKFNPCGYCAGKGRVRIADSNEIQRCSSCYGTGTVPPDPCMSCNGSGMLDGTTEIMVNFDAGIAEGNYISIPGMGHAGPRGAASGDLLIFIEEEQHRLFKRRGYDLETEATITLATAVLGGSASVSDLKNQTHSFKINAGTNPGKLFRLDGLGLPFYKKNNRGNLFVKVTVEIPKNLSDKAQKAFKVFCDAVDESHAGKNYTKIGRFHVVELPEESNINKMLAAFNTADVLSDSRLAIAIDLAKVSLLNSGNISRIISIQRKMSRYNEKLVLTSVNDSVFRVFADCNLDKVFTFAESENDLFEIPGPETEAPETDPNTPPPPVRQVDTHWIIYGGMETFNPEIFNRKDVVEVFGTKGYSVGLDLHDVKFINSLILGEFIRKLKEAKKMGGNFFLFAPTAEVMVLIQATNLDKLFTIVKSERELKAMKVGV